MFYWFLKIILTPIFRTFFIKEVNGLENIPKNGPIIIAANHSSYFDFLCLGVVVPRRMYFLAAEKFYKSVFWKPIMILTGQIKVERESDDKSVVFNAAKNILSRGKVLGIFPEGTRSRDGKIHKAFNGVAKIATENNANILPVAIKGTFEVMSPNEKMFHFKRVCKLEFLKPIPIGEIQKNGPEVTVQEILMPRIAEKVGNNYDFN